MLLRKSSTKFKSLLPIGFTLIVCMMVATSLITVSQTKKSSEEMIQSVRTHFHNNHSLSIMSQAALSRSIYLMEILYAEDPFKVDELYQQMNVAATTFVIARNSIARQKLLDDVQQMLDKQIELARINGPLQNKVYDLVFNDEREAAEWLFSTESLPRQKLVLDNIREMVVYEYEAALKNFEVSRANNEKVLSRLFVLEVIGILVSVFLIIFVLKKQKESDEALAALATTDILTDLPNRANLIDSIDSQIEKEPDSVFAVIFFDIDYFKSINDNYGHEVGDMVLRMFADKVTSYIEPVDILSRFGGDEFVLLLRSICSESDAIAFSDALTENLDTSFMIDNNEIFLSSSIGVSLYSRDGGSAKVLLKNADVAMYLAKESGRNCYKLFSKETRHQLERDHDTCHSLHSILKGKNISKELGLLYQPLLNINNGDIKECEALLRWTKPNGDQVAPDEFIPLAEKNNLIEKLNLFVIDEACQQQCEWRRIGITDVRVNINLSGNKIIFKNLLNQLQDNINRMALDPKLFGIELTERTLYEISDETIKALDKVRKLGIKISIDDFGIDYSSLSYLKKLPITTLKIDKAFIAGLPDDQDDRALVKAIITLAHSLKLNLVAEGVETAEQVEFLKRHSCNIAQGYFYHAPLPAVEMTRLKLVA